MFSRRSRTSRFDMLSPVVTVTGWMLSSAGALTPCPPLWQLMLADSIAGACGGMAKTFCTYPLDVATTRREVSIPNTLRKNSFCGLGFTLAMSPVYAALFHCAYVAAEHASKGSRLASVAGATAGSLAASSIGVPMECIKHRLQLGATLCEACRFGIYDGYISTLARNLPYNVVVFVAFNALSALSCDTLLASLGAGLLTAIVTHPLDVINTRVQAARIVRGKLPDSLIESLRSAAKSKSLLDGLQFRCLAFPPSSLVFFSLYNPIRLAVLDALACR